MRPTRKMISLDGSIITNVDGMGNLCLQKRKSTISKAIVLFFALILMSHIGKAQTTVTFGTTGSNTWVCPTGVTSITVNCWGAGGGGGSNSSTAVKCGGGGGGAYASSTISVTPGTTYYINVGAGAAATNGGNSWLNASTTSPYASVNSAPTGTATGILAEGGKGVTAAGTTTGGTGGLAANSYGTTKWNGGTGGTGGATWSGSGGGGAGSSTVGSAGNGTTGVGGAGGTGNPNAGTGGVGKNANGAGGAGVTYGGGGGGAYRAALGTNAGGAGAQGYVTITYTCPRSYTTLPYSTSFESGWGNSCSGTADKPDTYWSVFTGGTTPNSNDIWHRSDYPTGSDWTSVPTNRYNTAPLFSAGSYSAMFNSYYAPASSQGAIDLNVDLSAAGNKTLSFYYVNPETGASGLTVQLSTDGGATFGTTIATLSNNVTSWTLQNYTITATSATSVIRFLATSAYGSYNLGIDNLSLFVATPMAYSSCTTTQTNVASVSPSATNQEIIGMQVVTTGTTSPLTASSFTFSTNGSTSAANIANAKLWTTGTSSTFATTTQLGSATVSPSGSFTITGGTNMPYTLASGTNYFWLTYDIVASPTIGNVVDAECTSITVTSARTPTATAPAGSRTIALNFCTPTTSASNTYINNFSTTGGTANITNNATGYTGSGYNNYTAQSVSQYPGNAINWSYAMIGGTAGVGIWVDWNNDGDFVDAGESVYNSSGCISDGTVNGNFSVPGGQASGNYRMRILTDYITCTPVPCAFGGTRGEIEDYTFTVLTPVAMSYVSCTTTQASTASIAPGSTSQAILGMQVVTTGTSSPLTASSFTFSTNGSTTAANIANAKLWTTGTSSTFATTTQLGSATVSPSGNFTITGGTNMPYTLSSGTNYFWLTYDIIGSPVLGNVVDAECTSITVSSARTPSTTAPAGTRTIEINYCAPTTSSSSTYINSFSTSGGTTNITNNSTGYTGSGFNNYSAQSVSQYESSSINWSYTIAGGSSGVGIWVDWNSDGDFIDANESVYNSSGSWKADGTYTGNFSIPSGQAVGNYRMRILVDYNSATPVSCSFAGTRGEIEDYTVTVLTPVAMTFVSCTATQNNVNVVPPFTSNAEIIGIEVVTNGTLSPLNATYLSFLTTGSTNALVDIGTANLYYTGTSNTFAATNRFGSTKMQPNGRFSFTGTQPLSAGTNYFWLAYDIPLTATLGNIVDAQCDTVTVTTVRTPSTTNPTGNRVIGNVINMNNNPETVCYANFYDNGGPSGNYSDGVNYSKTFIPDAGKVMKIAFSSFNTAEVYDSLTIYDGPSNASPVIGKYYGAISPNTVIATNTGELTLSFKSDGMTNSAGWNALVTCESLPPNCATLSTPANNASNQPTNTPIVWISGLTDLTHQAATSYKLYFGTDAAASNIHNGTNIGNVTSWGMMLDTSTTYYWKIVPVNASGEATGCTTIHSFTTANTITRTTYNVPGDYATIKAAYNACTAASPYIINVTTGYTGEGYPIALNADVASVVSNRSAANPIIIRPSATFSYTFLGAATKVFEFSGGAKYITIDGRQGGTGTANSFIFKNTSTTTPVISFTGDNSYNTLQYCKIQGNNLSTGIVDLTNPSGSGIRYITIDNNEITKNTGTPSDGILTEGTNALKNTKITITNNKIYDIYADVAYPTHGIYMGSNGFNYDCTISGNSVYLTSTVTPTSNSVQWYGILVKGNNHVVTSNYVGGTAASCGGTSMTIAGTKENHIYAITVVGTLASSTTNVENNTVNNISLSTTHRSADNLTARSATGSDQTFAGITITEGAAKVHNNTIGGPTAGSITVINTNTSNPSTWNDGSNWGYSAELVGIVYNTKTGTINNTGNTVQGLWCYPSSTATTNLNARVIGIYAYTNASDNSGYTHKIQNNTIGGTGGLKAGNNTASDAFVYGIITSYGRGTIHIKNNTISNLWVNATGDYGYLRGIHNNGGIRAEIENNTISNLVCAANNTFGTGGDHRNRAIVGLMCDNDGGDCDYFFLIKNTVYDLRSTATSATLNMIGIYYRHNIAPVYGRVYGNKVYSINASTTADTSKLIGIWAYGQNTITYNNMVSLGNNVSVAAGASCPNAPLNSGNYQLIGIENNYGKNEYYYNTINIIGTSTGGSNTYAYKYVNPGTESLTRVFRNNIFSNTRSSTSGTQKNYAFSVSLQEAYGKFTSDFNYFYVSGTNGVLFDDFGTDRTTIAAWTASSGKDANSTGTGVLTPADPLFVAPCNCDCNLDITDLASPIVGTGSTIGVPTFILDDFNNYSRNSNNNVGAVIVGVNTLPIELLSFTGKKVDKVTKLEWITSTEINNDRFTIERSSDGIHFEPIATLKGAGNSNIAIKYEVIDEKPLNGINYYRLKQTDYDGAFSYSTNIVAINYSDDSFMVQVYPNPFNQKLNVNITGIDDEEAQISIYDIAGKQIYRQSVNSAGNTFQIELESNIPNGVYFMTVQVTNVVKHIKIIKSNK